MAEIGVGIIGCGARSRRVVRMLLERAPDAAVRALYDPEPAAIEATRAGVAPDARVHDDFRGVVDDPAVGWVVVGSWNRYHATHIIAALEAGKHVFCEKPLATTLEDAAAIRAAHARSGRQFVMGFTLRYTPHYRRIQRLVREGAIGELISFEFNETLEFNHGGYIHQDWRRHSRHAGTHLLEKCCHDIDVVNWIAQSLATRVASFGGLRFFLPENACHVDRIGPEPITGRPAYQSWPNSPNSPFTADKDIIDHQVAILEYANGVKATFHTNCNAALHERRLYLLGAEGTLRADLIAGRVEVKRIGWDEPTVVYPSIAGGHGGGDEVMAQELSELMQNGHPPATTLEDGLIAAITCFAIDDAMTEGCVIDVRPYWERASIALPARPKPGLAPAAPRS